MRRPVAVVVDGVALPLMTGWLCFDCLALAEDAQPGDMIAYRDESLGDCEACETEGLLFLRYGGDQPQRYAV